MNISKKILALILVFAMSLTLCFSLFSCNKEESNDDNKVKQDKGKSDEPVSDEEVFDYLKEEIKDGTGDLVASYLKNVKATDLTGASGELSLEVGDDVIDFLEQMLASSGVSVSLEGFEKIGLSFDGETGKSTYKFAMGVLIGNVSVVSAELIADMQENIMYLRVPELNSSWIEYPLDISEEALLSFEYIEDIINALPSEDVAVSVLERYIKIILDALTSSKVETVTATVNGVSEEIRRCDVTLDEKTVRFVVSSVLKEFIADETLEKIVRDFVSAIPENNITDWDRDWNEVIEAAQDGLDNIDSIVIDEPFNFTMYINASNELCGIDFEFEGDGFKWISVSSDGKIAEEITVWSEDYEVLNVVGKGETSKKKNIEYTVTVDGTESFVVELVDVALDGSSGKIKLSLTDELWNNIGKGTDLSQIFELFGTPYLQYEWKISSNSSEMKLKVMSESKGNLLTLNLSANQKSGSVKVDVPSSNVYSIDNIDEWASGISFNKILNNINKTGISKDLKDMISYLLSMASESM